MRILFVCTGNICRSPMAEALLRDAVRCDPVLSGRGIEVRSAGTSGLEGVPASDLAVAVMRQRGIDLRAHRGQCLTEALIDWADILLLMEENHRLRTLRLAPSASAKLALFAEYAGSAGEVDDPYGFDEDVYRRCADQLATLTAGLLLRLRSSHPNVP